MNPDARISLCRQVRSCVTIALFLGGVAACAGTQSSVQAVMQPINDGRCPDLSGNYVEIGEGHYSSGKTFEAHLMGNEFANSFYRMHDVADHNAVSVRVYHSRSSDMHMEAIVNGRVVGAREFSNADGWYCSRRQLVKFDAKPFGIEAGSGTQVELTKIFISEDRKLCRIREWKMDYAFGGPRDSGYSLTACYSPKPK